MSSSPGFEQELSNLARWDSAPGSAELAALPPTPAVYLLLDVQQRPVQLATTQHLRRAVESRLTAPPAGEASRRADLAAIVRGVRWREAAAPFESRWWYYTLCRAARPREYRELISFGPAAFLHVDWNAPVAELRVSERVYRDAGVFQGPFPTRAECQRALEGLWDLFDLCRYPEQVRRAPQGQRCAYAEMGRCDAPCDGGAPLSAYEARCRAAWRFATGAIEPWIAVATEQMKWAAADRKFEQAGLLKKQIEFARKWNANWSAGLRDAANWRMVFALPVARRKAWRLMLFDRGVIVDGPIVAEGKLAAGIGAWVDVARGEAAVKLAEMDAAVRMEQAWLMAQFLGGREAETAIVVDCLGVEANADYGAHVAARLRELRRIALERRAKRGAAALADASITDDPGNMTTDSERSGGDEPPDAAHGDASEDGVSLQE